MVLRKHAPEVFSNEHKAAPQNTANAYDTVSKKQKLNSDNHEAFSPESQNEKNNSSSDNEAHREADETNISAGADPKLDEEASNKKLELLLGQLRKMEKPDRMENPAAVRILLAISEQALENSIV